jgi:hypothetical protein
MGCGLVFRSQVRGLGFVYLETGVCLIKEKRGDYADLEVQRLKTETVKTHYTVP